MFRRIFQTTQTVHGTGVEEAGPELTSNSNLPAKHVMSRQVATRPKPATLGLFEAFEEIYKTSHTFTPANAYSILKVSEMLKSSHLTGMSMESKRAALMMALEAAGIDVKDVIQDAMLRHRALNDYEEGQLKLLREFETVKGEENRQIQAELDAITAQYLARIQANIDEVAEQQDAFRAWQKTKAQEAAAITDATSFCHVPDATLDHLSTALERNGSLRR
jgi:hypothetical protein